MLVFRMVKKEHAYKLTPCKKHTEFNSGCNGCWIETIKHPSKMLLWSRRLLPTATFTTLNVWMAIH